MSADDREAGVMYTLTLERRWEGDRYAVRYANSAMGSSAVTPYGYLRRESDGCGAPAPLSMAVFLLSHPDPVAAFGAPVFDGQCGMEHMRELLACG